MGFLIKIMPVNLDDIYGYYVGTLDYYSYGNVIVPRVTEDADSAKTYKYRKSAENAVNKILNESSYVSLCEIEEFEEK